MTTLCHCNIIGKQILIERNSQELNCTPLSLSKFELTKSVCTCIASACYQKYSAEVKSLVQWMLCKNVKRRLSIADILKKDFVHEWVCFIIAQCYVMDCTKQNFDTTFCNIQ